MAALTVVDLVKDPMQQGSLTRSTTRILTLLVLALAIVGCRDRYREDLDYSYGVQQSLALDDVAATTLVQFESVHWDADDQAELRSMITDDTLAAGRSVLLIGAGPGVISILCQQHGATKVVATDTNPAAVANAKYNVAKMELDTDIEVRKAIRRKCFSAVKPDESFDLIIVDPNALLRWHIGPRDPESPGVGSFLDELLVHSKPGGRCIVAFHHGEQFKKWREAAVDRGYEEKVLGERVSASLNDEIYPAVLLEIRIPIDQFSARTVEEAK